MRIFKAINLVFGTAAAGVVAIGAANFLSAELSHVYRWHTGVAPSYVEPANQLGEVLKIHFIKYGSIVATNISGISPPPATSTTLHLWRLEASKKRTGQYSKEVADLAAAAEERTAKIMAAEDARKHREGMKANSAPPNHRPNPDRTGLNRLIAKFSR